MRDAYVPVSDNGIRAVAESGPVLRCSALRTFVQSQSMGQLGVEQTHDGLHGLKVRLLASASY
jgi:hypothetical protein